MPNLHVVLASTRPTRKGPAVAEWFLGRARAHARFDVELVDLAAVGLPVFNEPEHPRLQRYAHEHTKAWSRTVARADAFVFVTPEHDYGPPASLLNALQYLVQEWSYKPLGFVSYGGVSAGLRGVQVTKGVASALKLVPIPEAVSIPFFAKHLDEATGRFDPGEVQERAAAAMLDELLRWSGALRPLREPRPA